MSKNVGTLRYVPDLHFLGEAIVGGDVRVGFVDRGDEEVLAIWSGIELLIVCRLSHRRDRRRSRVNQGKLRTGEVIEEILVVSIAQRVAVFVGAALSFFPSRFLNARTRRQDGFG